MQFERGKKNQVDVDLSTVKKKLGFKGESRISEEACCYTNLVKNSQEKY